MDLKTFVVSLVVIGLVLLIGANKIAPFHPENKEYYRESNNLAPYFHEIITLADGTKVGQLGAMQYILNEDRGPCSPGFHVITPIPTGYTAEIGASNYRLNKSGSVIEKSWHAPEPPDYYERHK